MALNNPKPASNRKLKSPKAESVFPDDKTIANRYITWKNLLDKYNKQFENDENGLTLDDAVDLYGETDKETDDQQQTVEEASESSDDDDASDKENEQSGSSYAAFKDQLQVALKQRTAEWKCNGMEQIFNSNFSLSVDHVQRWLQQGCQPGTGKQITQERETRFTEYDGSAQMDVTHKENVSILNETAKQQYATENSSSCVYSDSNRSKRVIVHQVEKTIISSYLTIEPEGASGPSGTVSRLDLNSLVESIPNITPFKMPMQLSKATPRDRIMKFAKGGSSSKGVNIDALKKTNMGSMLKSALKSVPKTRVIDDVKNRSKSGNQQQKQQRRVQFKPTKKVKSGRTIILDSSESSGSESSASTTESKTRTSTPYARKHTVSDHLKNALKQMENSKTAPKAADKQLPATKDAKRANFTKRIVSSASSLSSTSSTLDSDDSELDKPLIPPAKQTGNHHQTPVTNAKKAPAPKPSTVNGQTPTPSPSETVQYPLPDYFHQMLTRNGRCQYKTQGIVIYRPKQTHPDRASGQPSSKICISTKDLDLSGIKSSVRRKKFDDFTRLTHPNATLVYYESEDEAIPLSDSNDSDCSDDDDDDPILNFKPELCILAFLNDDVQAS
ncbi:uncharacterized protein LOC120904041 [Anopheles arabiensis]|uniref:Uncharacterized protein n=1 Tax=Anopheles arabiensis TaxID=7173 RepID=A0A8W7MHE7_ANOAR|nr:uncharacterized protein LOC120904041 [Anopheles arabiensis]